jgi:hypothetical protein
VLNFVLQSLIQPRFVGDAVGLSATVTFLALVFWAWLLGPLGAVLAIPVTLLAKAILVDVDPSANWAETLLRSSATPRAPGGEKPRFRSFGLGHLHFRHPPQGNQLQPEVLEEHEDPGKA